MKHIIFGVLILSLLLGGCAAREEQVITREPKSIITKDDYEDLKIKEPEPEEPVVVDYEEEGEYIQNFEPLKKK